ncbi:MAG: DUF4127 family protein [Candidatus Eremiobacteraeota bacterium]|nr:DUF4127 family protein [Candidatus Eremiobacteraeota bacterium]
MNKTNNNSIFRTKRVFLIFFFTLILISFLTTSSFPAQSNSKKVVIIPLDSRNQTYEYVQYIAKICGWDPVVPPREIMGNISKYEDAFKKQWNVWFWLKHNLDDDCKLLIISADSLIYGGLLESRKSSVSTRQALNSVALIKIIRKKYPQLKILVFTSIPRKEAQHRQRNMSANMKLLEYVKEGVIDFLSVSGDDVTDISNQVREIVKMKDYIKRAGIGKKVLISDVDRIRLGIDESAMVLFTRFLNEKRKKRLKVYIEYRDITSSRMKIDHYSATPIMSVALDMVDSIGADVVYEPEKADLILAVNHLSGEKSIDDFLDRIENLLKEKPVTVGDLSNRKQQAEFFRALYKRGMFNRLSGYANWGMGTNTLGTALCEGCASLYCPDRKANKEKIAFLYERMITDFIYLDGIHLKLPGKTGIPAYSYHRMSIDEEKKALDLTNKKIMENLNDLGIKYRVLKEGEPGAESGASNIPGSGKINYIPLDPGEIGKTPGERIVFQFTANIPGNKYEKKAIIRIGPISFPFHRLFEINIPIKVGR